MHSLAGSQLTKIPQSDPMDFPQAKSLATDREMLVRLSNDLSALQHLLAEIINNHKSMIRDNDMLRELKAFCFGFLRQTSVEGLDSEGRLRLNMDRALEFTMGIEQVQVKGGDSIDAGIGLCAERQSPKRKSEDEVLDSPPPKKHSRALVTPTHTTNKGSLEIWSPGIPIESILPMRFASVKDTTLELQRSVVEQVQKEPMLPNSGTNSALQRRIQSLKQSHLQHSIPCFPHMTPRTRDSSISNQRPSFYSRLSQAEMEAREARTQRCWPSRQLQPQKQSKHCSTLLTSPIMIENSLLGENVVSTEDRRSWMEREQAIDEASMQLLMEAQNLSTYYVSPTNSSS